MPKSGLFEGAEDVFNLGPQVTGFLLFLKSHIYDAHAVSICHKNETFRYLFLPEYTFKQFPAFSLTKCINTHFSSCLFSPGLGSLGGLTV